MGRNFGRGGRGGSAGQLFGGRLGDRAVDGQGDGGVGAAEDKAVRGDEPARLEVDLPALVEVQGAQGLEGGRARLSQVVDKELQLEHGGIGGSHPEAVVAEWNPGKKAQI